LLLLLLLLCLGGVLWWLFKDKDNNPSANGTPTPTSAQTVAPPTTTKPAVTTPPPTTPAATTPPATTPAVTPSATTATPGTGTGQLEIPNVKDMTSSDATKKLQGVGFTKIKVVRADGGPEAMTDDWIVTAQTPSSGSKTAADTEIILTVVQKTGKG